jgi:predicted  nucleic acid-binding Zn-ribbon protein
LTETKRQDILTSGSKKEGEMIEKGCPRCGGDVFVEDDIFFGKWLFCLQCGWDKPYKPAEDNQQGEIEKKENLRGRRGYPISHGIPL